MDPFNNYTNNSLINQQNITIMKETLGKKKNTYILGWDIDDATMKQHLQIIKRKNGCNGTIKKILNNETSEHEICMHFQGDKIDYITKYLINLGIDIKNIHIKG